MNDDPELIKKLREATQATEQWPASMKKLHELRQRADAFFSERDGQGGIITPMRHDILRS